MNKKLESIIGWAVLLAIAAGILFWRFYFHADVGWIRNLAAAGLLMLLGIVALMSIAAILFLLAGAPFDRYYPLNFLLMLLLAAAGFGGVLLTLFLWKLYSLIG